MRPLGRGQVGFAGGALALRRFVDEAIRNVARTRFGAKRKTTPFCLTLKSLRGAATSARSLSPCASSRTSRRTSTPSRRFAPPILKVSRFACPILAAMTYSDAALRPAVCLPVYRSLEGTTLPEGGLTITTVGRHFATSRATSKASTGSGISRCARSSSRGSTDFVEERRERVIELVVPLMKDWDLASRLVSASDPFFATVRGTKALWQRSPAV